MTDCVFCRIIAKEIPANIVHEDDRTLVFLDINPVHPGHALIVPKRHTDNLGGLAAEDFMAIGEAAQKTVAALTGVLGYDGANLLQNNGQAAGQAVPHVHFHVIPRKTGDGLAHWPGVQYANGQADEVAKGMAAAWGSN